MPAVTKKPAKQPKKIGHPFHNGVEAYPCTVFARMEESMRDELLCRGENMSDAFRSMITAYLSLMAEGRRQLRDMPFWQDRKNLKKAVEVFEKHGMAGVVQLRPMTYLQQVAMKDAIKRFVRVPNQTIDNLLR